MTATESYQYLLGQVSKIENLTHIYEVVQQPRANDYGEKTEHFLCVSSHKHEVLTNIYSSILFG